MTTKKKSAPAMIVEPHELKDLIGELLLLEAWCSAVRSLLAAQVQAGVDIPGVSLEPTTPQRKWDLPDKDLRALLVKTMKKHEKPCSMDDVAPRVTLSPAAVEKVIGKPLFAELLAEYAPAKPTGNFSLKIGSIPPKAPGLSRKPKSQ